MEIKYGNGRFYIGDESNPTAVLNAREENGVLIADHTFVAESLRGQNIAGRMFDELVKYARENGYKIRPICSYIVKKFESDESLKDLL